MDSKVPQMIGTQDQRADNGTRQAELKGATKDEMGSCGDAHGRDVNIRKQRRAMEELHREGWPELEIRGQRRDSVKTPEVMILWEKFILLRLV